MRAIFIDPLARTVEHVEVNGGRDIGRFVQDITLASEYPNGDTLYVSDNGLSEAYETLKGRGDIVKACHFDVGAHQPFAGYGLIVGPEDEEGEITDVTIPIEAIRAIIFFLHPPALEADGSKH